jgi:hypothetical protein
VSKPRPASHARASAATKDDDPAQQVRWPVRKTMAPTDRGAIKLERIYGGDLVCVRYRLNVVGDERLTTVELVVDRAVVERRNDPVVSFKIHPWEDDLRLRARQRGARFDPITRMWRLAKREVLRLGLRDRIAIEDAQR